MKLLQNLSLPVIYFILAVTILLGFIMRHFGRGKATSHKEPFVGTVASIEQAVTDIYMEVLQRQPKGGELVDSSRSLQSKRITVDGLKQKLMDSEEYIMSIKTQNNSLAPELMKMLSDKALIETIQKIYAEEKRLPLKDALLIPFKDIYVHLEYNEYAFRAFLRHSHLKAFVEDIEREADLTKTAMLKLFNKHFDIEKLKAEGDKIATKLGKASLTTKAGALRGRDLNEKDNDSSAYLQSLYDEGSFVFDKNMAAAALDGHSRMVLTHHGNMVLRPEYAWSVPQQRAPVCTTLGKKQLVQPVMLPNKMLNGTLLGDAADTDVGSIMPKIDFKEYIDLPKKQKQ